MTDCSAVVFDEPRSEVVCLLPGRLVVSFKSSGITNMDSNRGKKKGDVLTAFHKGDIEKIMQFANNVPSFAKASIPFIVEQWRLSTVKLHPLTLVILNGNYYLCKLLIEDGVPLSGHYGNQLNPLSWALYHKQSGIAELLIQSGASVNMLENDGNTSPMFWAIHRNSPPHILEKIISSGFSVNAIISRDFEMRAIHSAAWENNLEAIEVLINHSADLNVINSSGESALDIAVGSNYLDVVKQLVKHGANLDNRKSAASPLLVAIKMQYIEMTKILLNAGVDLDEGRIGSERVFPLLYALASNVDIAMLLINRGVNVKAKIISTLETPLHMITNYTDLKYKGDTLRKIQVKIAKVLIEKGADTNAKDCDGMTPLDCAIYSENTELCKILLREGAKITGNGRIQKDGPKSNRFEYITRVSAFKCPDLIKLCLECGADYNYFNRYGISPYHYIFTKHNPEMFKVFWQHSCPFDQPERKPGMIKQMLMYNPDAKVRYILVVQKNFIDGIQYNKIKLVRSALLKGAEPRGCSIKIPSTLHYLAENGNHKIARVLLEKGVHVDRVNEKGQTPLYIAIQKKNYEICKVFLEFGACFNYRSNAAGECLKFLSKNHQQMHKLFKQIYTCFRLVRQGDRGILKLLQRVATEDMALLRILMNCVNNKGETLIGASLSLGHTQIAKELMMFKVKKITDI